MPDLRRQAEAEGLLEEVKNFLDITWTDNDLDEKLTGMIGRGMAAIGRLTPFPVDWANNSPARTLLFNRVMYDRDKRLNEFYENWRAELLAFQLDEEVAEFGAKGEPDVQ